MAAFLQILGHLDWNPQHATAWLFIIIQELIKYNIFLDIISGDIVYLLE